MKKIFQYDIKTLQDMIDCTNSDNLDNFMVDLKMLMSTAHLVRSIQDSINIVDKVSAINFIWIDDNKHNATINFTENNSNGKEDK